MNRKQILKSFKILYEYCAVHRFIGYSLFDSHTSKIPFTKLPHKLSFIINQIVKRSPINIRPVLGIRKNFNPKGMGLFLYAFSKIKADDIVTLDNLEDIMRFFFEWLRENYSKKYIGKGWGYHYDWPKSDGAFVPRNTPNTVVTAFNTRAIFEYFQLTKDPEAFNLILGAKDFILNNTFKFSTSDGICFSYTPIKNDITINANLLAAEVLAYSDYILKEKKFQETILSVLNFTMNRQNDDGSWYYSFNVKTNEPKKQIDFHQGYVLDSIYLLCKYSTIDMDIYKKNVIRGLEFYFSKQFDPSGFAYWRYPQKWPIDIHNQSQGIITFSRFSDFDKKYLSFAKKIAHWTINNMQSKNGGFYYQKWSFVTNKVSYMRWNNAWMLVALSYLLEKLK